MSNRRGNRPTNIVHEDQVAVQEESHGKFAYRRRKLAQASGGADLGCSLYEIPPGARAFPHHYHLANEEAIYVLAGAGAVRLGDAEHAIAAGDYIALPAGAEHAHQIINTGAEPLRYLCVSTMREPDVSVYPDSNKIGIFAGSPPGGDPKRRTLHAYLSATPTRPYYDGED